jgi:hypothetical protein
VPASLAHNTRGVDARILRGDAAPRTIERMELIEYADYL